MITAYLKPTNYCPVGCEHCYLPTSVRQQRAVMSTATLEVSARFLAEMSRSLRDMPISIIWHGGEPMAAEPKWYEDAGSVLDRYLGPGRYKESMQTSLMLLNDDFIQMAAKRFCGVFGSSLDFSQRMIGGSKIAYQNAWMQEVKRCREAGVEVVPSTVPTKDEVGRASELFGWFMNNGFKAFNVERFNRFGGLGMGWPSNRAHGQFLGDLTVEVLSSMSRCGSAPLINVVEAALRGVLHGTSGDRWGGQCQSLSVVIEPNGDLNTCPDRAAYEEPFGTVFEGYEVFTHSSPRRKWARTQQLQGCQDCQDCPHASWCKGGCPIAGYFDGDECPGFRSFLDQVMSVADDSEMRKVMRQYLEQRP